jgi:thiamine pyrophosphokinase
MRALIFADGEMPSAALVHELRERAKLVVAADGAAHKALAAGIEPDAVVGDLDSISDEARALLGPDRIYLRPSRDDTDLQKSIDFCLERGCRAMDILAGGGGRADHALANLSVLCLFRGASRIRIVDDLFEIELVQETAVIEAPAGTVVSLVAIGACEGVTTTGLRWDLMDYALSFSPYGVHNEVRTSPATVSVRRGDLLLFRGRWVEKHA